MLTVGTQMAPELTETVLAYALAVEGLSVVPKSYPTVVVEVASDRKHPCEVMTASELWWDTARGFFGLIISPRNRDVLVTDTF